MLQVIITPGERYSLAEMAQMAVEAGAGWLQLRVPGLEGGALRDAAADIVALCRQSGVMLTIEDSVEAARELGLHGVYLSRGGDRRRRGVGRRGYGSQPCRHRLCGPRA